LPALSFAQGNYKQGFIVNAKGDTLKGFIDLKEWGSNPTSINFKSSIEKSDKQVFTINDISYFEVPKMAAYKKFKTSISLDETSIQKVGDHRDTSSKVDVVFLKVQQRGKNVILYSYTDDIKTRFYIYDSKTDKLEELIYRIYYVPNNRNNVSTVSQNEYKQQLLLIAQQFDTYNDKIQNLLENANYLDVDLKSICSKINNNAKEEEKHSTSGKKSVRLFAGAGAGFNTITRTGTFILTNSSPAYSSVTPKISAGISFYPVPDVGASVMKLELSYSSAEYQTSGNLYYYDPTIISTYEFKQSTISVTPQFQYNIYNSDPFKFYLDAGLSLNFSTYTGNSIYDKVTNDVIKKVAGLSNRWLSVPLKAGVVLKNNFDISATYIFPTAISDYAGSASSYNYLLKLSSLQIGLSYIF
jgi:hypothetical protein